MIEGEDYLRPPEHEIRCDEFLADVRREVVANYPELTFWIENSTADIVEGMERRLEMVDGLEEIDEELKNNLKKAISKGAEAENYLSTLMNTGGIVI